MVKNIVVSSRFFCGAVLLAVLGAVIGCGPTGPKNVVTGKVTLNGEKVEGTVHFIGSDGKEVTCPINPDGSYYIENPPAGECVVLVKPRPGAAQATPAMPENATAMPGMPTMKAAAKPPAKYSDAAGGLKFTVTTDKQTYDIVLTE